jgi:hypothetical protein
MRKSLGVIAALYLVIAFTVSDSVSSVVRAMPAPTPGNIELSIGLAQWGAETEATDELSDEQVTAAMQELARPFPAGKSKTAMCETLVNAAQEHELPVGFFVRLIDQESGFDPEVVSHAGAQGVAQFMPKVAVEWGLKNPFDPHAALDASARFLRSLYNQLGNWGLAAAAYNGGIGRVQKWRTNRGKLPDETRNYVKTITGMPAEKWADGKPQLTKFSIPPRAPCQDYAHLADPYSNDAPPVRVQETKIVQVASTPQGGSPSKVAGIPQSKAKVAIVAVKRGIKVAVINVARATSKAATKVAAVKSRIAAPKAAAVKVAEKSSAKPAAKAKDTKKARGKGVQVADARGARK